MIEKINIAELLKDCPSGMELDCTMFENVHFERIEKNVDYPIIIRIGKTDIIRLTKYGCWNKYSNAKCVIFPKGKTTWDGFHRPFKDGDILATNDGSFIAIIKKNGGKYYCCCHTNGSYFVTDYCGWFDRLATEEEKQKLFDVIKAHGYKWNPESKNLEKLLRFNVGDVVRCINNINNKLKIIEITDNYYICENNFKIYFKFQEYWELVSNKFDVIAFKPFDKVLVRDDDACTWRADFYSHYENNACYWYVCVGDGYKQCIPYNEETAHLIGTTDDCPDKYKIWKDE